MGRLAELQRNLLTQLMGAEAMGIITTDVSMWDPKVCRPFVTGICPHDLFTNTKMDLGSCARTHSPKVKTEYTLLLAKAEEEKDTQTVAELNRLRVEYENTILGFVDECDRRIRAAQRRLEKTPEENNRTTALMREIGEIEGAYQAAMADVESLGSEGKVEESISQLTRADLLKSEKAEKERELQQMTENAGASGHQKLRVCDVCGAYLSILDSDRRLADHFSGKLHLGYYQLRELMKEWRERGTLVVAERAPEVKKVVVVPVAEKVVEKMATVGFRPIPADKLLKSSTTTTSSGPPPSAPSGPGRSSGTAGDTTTTRERGSERERGGGERERGSERDRERSDRHGSRDRGSGERSSRRNDDDRDRERSSRRSGEGDSDRHRSSRHSRDDGGEDGEERSSHRSSRRHGEDDKERRSSRKEEGGEKSSSSRTKDKEDGEGSEKRREKRESRRGAAEHEEGEEREERPDKDKRRRVD